MSTLDLPRPGRQPIADNAESTPVDDVRRIREKLSAEAGNDVRRLAERSRQTSEALCEKLGLRRSCTR